MSIEVNRLVKKFNNFIAVNNVHFRVETGSLVAILGPSGSGKSTLLRIIAGLEAPDTGDVRLTKKQPIFLLVTGMLVLCFSTTRSLNI